MDDKLPAPFPIPGLPWMVAAPTRNWATIAKRCWKQFRKCMMLRVSHNIIHFQIMEQETVWISWINKFIQFQDMSMSLSECMSTTNVHTFCSLKVCGNPMSMSLTECMSTTNVHTFCSWKVCGNPILSVSILGSLGRLKLSFFSLNIRRDQKFQTCVFLWTCENQYFVIN